MGGEDDDRKQFIDVPFASLSPSLVSRASRILIRIDWMIWVRLWNTRSVAFAATSPLAVACTDASEHRAPHVVICRAPFSGSNAPIAQWRRFLGSRFVYDPSASRFIINAAGSKSIPPRETTVAQYGICFCGRGSKREQKNEGECETCDRFPAI